MSQWLDDQAQESEHEEENVPASKRARIASDDDDDDEEEDESKIAEEMQGFVVTGDEEDEEAEGNDGDKKSDESEEDEEEELLEDDEDLLEENLGISVKKRKRRIQVGSDSEDENPKNNIENQLFSRGDEDEADESERVELPPMESGDYEEAEEDDEAGEESGVDDFIEEDENDLRKMKKKGKRKHIPISDSALQEAREIFGEAIDLEDLYPGEDEEEEVEELDREDEYEEEGEERPAERRVKRVVAKKKPAKQTLLDQMDPSELDRGFLSEADKKIQLEDKPERFQLRNVPVTELGEGELIAEGIWIFRHLYEIRSISLQQSNRKTFQVVHPQIMDTLNFIRNHDFEVPFIAFYRKEYVNSAGSSSKDASVSLTLQDLWGVYKADEKWCQLRTRMKSLHALFKRMQQFQYDSILKESSRSLNAEIRILSEEDLQQIWKVETPEDLQDVYLHFLLYYSRDVQKMVQFERTKIVQESGNEEEQMHTLKQASRQDKYSICVEAGLCRLANHFGLTPRQFAENLANIFDPKGKDYVPHEVEHCPRTPIEAVDDFIPPHEQIRIAELSTEKRSEAEGEQQVDPHKLILKAAAYVVGIQLSREPAVRRLARLRFYDRGVVCVRPTRKGIKEIDENSAIYPYRYLKNKLIRDLQNEQFLHLMQGESMGLIKVTLLMDAVGSETSNTAETNVPLYLRELIDSGAYYIKHCSDDNLNISNENIEHWSELRNEALKVCAETLSRYMEKETRIKLVQEAREVVLTNCSDVLRRWIEFSPFVPEHHANDEDGDSTKSRVLGIAFSRERDQASFCALLDGEGEVTDHLRLVHLTKRKNSFRPDESRLKDQDLDTLRQFLANKKPHVVAIAGESLDALMIKDDLVGLLNDMESSGDLDRSISVEIVDNDLAKVYMNSRKAQQDFADFPVLLRQAVSVARRLQDPLLEFCQMCTIDEDILCMKFHTLQDMIPKEELWSRLQIEFINRVNEVGVDINRCLEHPHTAAALQFVCGLGARKAAYLLKILRQNDNLLENRTKLVTVCHMAPKVFMNCAGFIKIDTSKVAEKTDVYVEVLDGTRIHPETYEWARKMAVDALEYDDTTEDANPASALEEILETPERLKDLDLDAFAEELQRQGFGNKNVTLYDIRAELTHRYKDMRRTYQSPSNEQLFFMLTKESELSFKSGKLVLGRVINVVYRKPRDDNERMAEPKRNEETGMWQCTVCQRGDFSELSEVWSHVDMQKCPGQAIGVRVKLENGLSGFIFKSNLSDKLVEHPADRVKVGMPLYCRVVRINLQHFSVDLSCKSSVLRDDLSEFKPALDPNFDRESEEEDKKREKSNLNKKQMLQYVKRVIAHPCFNNCSYSDAELLLESRDQGEVIIRPSSKGEDHLSVTWKVVDDVYQHIDVAEMHKDNAFSIGRVLLIGDETFEDLDEIITRHIEPMAGFAREVASYKYYRVTPARANGGKADQRDDLEKLLQVEKGGNSRRIPYVLTACKEFPGKFMLSYLPRTKARHEFITVMPNGLKFRGMVHRSLTQLLAWFKEHFRDAIPGMTPLLATPMDQSSSHRGFTPYFDTASKISAIPPSQINWPTKNMPPPQMAYGNQGQPVYAATVQHQPRGGAVLNPPVGGTGQRRYPDKQHQNQWTADY